MNFFLCFVAIVRVRSIVLTSLFSLFYVTAEFPSSYTEAEPKTPRLFYFRSVKFHYVKETRMMLVAFWRTLVKIVVVFQHKRQRNQSFSRFVDNLKTPTRTVHALQYSM